MDSDGGRSRLSRLIEGERRSGLELIVGPSRYVDVLVRNSVAWITAMATGGSAAVLLAGNELGISRGPIAVVIGCCFAMPAVIPVIRRHGPPEFFPLLAISAGGLSGLVVWFGGPDFAVTAAIPPAYVAACSLFFSRRTTAIATTIAVVTYCAVFLFADGYDRPSAGLALVVTATIATAVVITRFVDGIERLSSSERRLHVEVVEARAQLETRVDEQVEQIERLGRLRRFLSPQVAETVLSSGDEDLLATHRRQIAVVFIDLRAFTGFSATAEPEEVVEVLAEFHAVVGVAVADFGATVGGFAGDGLMAYFNDPFPCEDPPGRALAMVQSLQKPMRGLRLRWRERGFNLGYGAGIAYGYATLGTIGFESRSEYTPIGSVVNLASRLCDEAGDGEALLDARAFHAVRDRVSGVAVELGLKGFNGTVNAHRLVIDDVA